MGEGGSARQSGDLLGREPALVHVLPGSVTDLNIPAGIMIPVRDEGLGLGVCKRQVNPEP